MWRPRRSTLVPLTVFVLTAKLSSGETPDELAPRLDRPDSLAGLQSFRATGLDPGGGGTWIQGSSDLGAPFLDQGRGSPDLDLGGP